MVSGVKRSGDVLYCCCECSRFEGKCHVFSTNAVKEPIITSKDESCLFCEFNLCANETLCRKDPTTFSEIFMLIYRLK